jgi:osmotically-inducible protein OsmY
VRRFLLVMLLLSPPVFSAAGTLDDMDLRSNVEASIRGTASTANLKLRIRVENKIAIPEGAVRDLNQADDVVELASRVRGIEGVDRAGLRLEFAGAEDAEIASLVTRAIFELPTYSGSSIRIAVEHGVVTLTGNIKNASWRAELHKLCGAITGVVDVVDRLESPATADERIQKALDNVFGVRVVPRFPGKVHVVVKEGAVVFEGHVPSLRDKRLAEKHAWQINGVRSVDNRLELSSGQAVQVIHP